MARFDSRSVFARLLDDSAGHWSIRPAGDFTSERRYADQAMVLQTVFRTASGEAVLTDALALGARERGRGLGGNVPHTLLREVTCSSGEVELALEFAPRPEYGLVTRCSWQPEVVRSARGAPMSSRCPRRFHCGSKAARPMPGSGSRSGPGSGPVSPFSTRRPASGPGHGISMRSAAPCGTRSAAGSPGQPSTSGTKGRGGNSSITAAAYCGR